MILHFNVVARHNFTYWWLAYQKTEQANDGLVWHSCKEGWLTLKAEGTALLDQLLPAAPRRAATTRRTELCCAWAGDGNDVEGDDDEDAVEDDDDEDDDYEEENDNHYPAREAQLWCAWSAEISFFSDFFSLLMKN